MNELVKVAVHSGQQMINARDLYETLGVGRDFSNWIKDRIEKYGFEEGRDYHLAKSGEVVSRPQGGGSARNLYLLTISTAKEIAMVENNEKGREIRLYLIKVEEAWNTPAMVMARALQIAQQEIDSQKNLLAEYKPKVDFFDAVASSKDALQMRDVAGVLNIPCWGRNKIFAFLRERKVLDARNVPYREYEDRGFFRVIEQKWTDNEGETRISLKTLVYQKGVDYIRKLIETETMKANIA